MPNVSEGGAVVLAAAGDLGCGGNCGSSLGFINSLSITSGRALGVDSYGALVSAPSALGGLDETFVRLGVF